jgi:hypothetical protein
VAAQQQADQHRAQYAEYGPRRADRNMQLPCEMQAKGIAHQPRAQVDQQETAVAEPARKQAPGYPQGNHVQHQVNDAAVQEHGRDQSPPFSALHQGRGVAAPMHHCVDIGRPNGNPGRHTRGPHANTQRHHRRHAPGMRRGLQQAGFEFLFGAHGFQLRGRIRAGVIRRPTLESAQRILQYLTSIRIAQAGQRDAAKIGFPPEDPGPGT